VKASTAAPKAKEKVVGGTKGAKDNKLPKKPPSHHEKPQEHKGGNLLGQQVTNLLMIEH
jgi:hypothetical protein